MFGTDEIIEIYRRRAANYNWTANLYYLFGFREYHYRRLAVSRLELSPGNKVLELGCGTGLNLKYLRDAVGSSGSVIGLDLTDSMLDRARERVQKKGWSNITLVRGDMTDYEFKGDLAGVISTFALSLAPDIGRVIRNVHAGLRSGGSLVVLDLREPSGWLSVLRPLILPIERPFGVSRKLVDMRPWEAIEGAMRDAFSETQVTQLFGGFAFVASGRKL